MDPFRALGRRERPRTESPVPRLPHHGLLGRDHEGDFDPQYALTAAVQPSSFHSLKVWDIAEDKPKCVQEREMKLGRLHCAEGCPDAPFVVCMGGDKNSDNLKVLDVRESADGE